MKRIVLLTHTHLSRNPRLVKEIQALYSLYQLDVIYFRYFKHFQSFDEQIEKDYPSVNFHPFQWTSKYKTARLTAILISKTSTILSKWLKIEILPEQRLFPGYFSLLRKARALPANYYHGHNPGTLAAAVNASRKNKALCGFDAEDFHRGEHVDGSKQKDLIIHIEDKYIPGLDFFITSSPLIQRAYKKIYPAISSECILNVFPLKKSNERRSVDARSLKLFWFSQSVGRDRGIQDIISGINKLKSVNVHLCIAGEVSDTDKRFFLKLKDNNSFTIEFKGFIAPDMLEKIIPQYDIGIASEVGHTENNKYALSNKIFTYLRSGTAILSSDTPAQKLFLKTYPFVGLLYSIKDPESVYEKIKYWIENPSVLEQQKHAALCLSQTHFNWEREQEKIKDRLNILLAS